MSGGGRVAEEYNAARHGTYGAYLRGKNLQTRTQGWTHATRDQVREGRDKTGRRFKDVTDQLGNHVIQHGRDQQSVIASPETVVAKIPMKEGSRVEP